MKIICVGPGAMGCLFSASLKRAGQDVTLMDYKEERAKQITRNGIQVDGVGGSFHVKVPVTTHPQFQDTDLVIICVKAGKTAEVARPLASTVPTKSLILSLQNGIGNIEILSETFGKDRVLGGVTSEAATLVAPGHVRHAGKGQTFVGPLNGNPSAVSEVVSIFNEAVHVARAKGIELPYPHPLSRVIDVCKATADNVASMLQDALNRRRTEVDFINAAIVREGKGLGIQIPVNTVLTELVNAIEKSYDVQIS